MPHEDYDGNYWDNAEAFWNNMGFGEYELTADEHREGFQLFADFLRDVDMGYRPEALLSFYEFLDYFGMEPEDFDWDEFREWYDSQ